LLVTCKLTNVGLLSCSDVAVIPNWMAAWVRNKQLATHLPAANPKLPGSKMQQWLNKPTLAKGKLTPQARAVVAKIFAALLKPKVSHCQPRSSVPAFASGRVLAPKPSSS
jgi:hypothetical protein